MAVALKTLVLGATGLLGNAVFRALSKAKGAPVYGTVRNEIAARLFKPECAEHLLVVEDLGNLHELHKLFDSVHPNVVINCTAVGRPAPVDPMKSVLIYSVLPQRLTHLCRLFDARLVQISSDGVFSGRRGSYTEDDPPDANDLYGISKLLGETTESHAVTLRTSIIGHELQSRSALLEWFLSQEGDCRCHTRAIFSGFPAIALAHIIRDVVIPSPGLNGVYHVASKPISKFDLLHLVAQRYGKTIKLIPDDQTIIDRSLVADRFAKATGYVAPEWPALVDLMYRDKFGLVRM